jgi:hypothetical protein
VRFRALLFPILVGCGFAASTELAAQSIVGGSLSGTTARSDGGVVPQALLTLSAQEGGFRRQATADQDGGFSFGIVEPGTYEIRAEAIGFRPQVITPVHVGGGDATVLRIELQPTRPPVEAVDTVAAPAAGPSLWRPGGARVGATRIDGLPDVWNDLASVVALSSRADAHLGSEGLPGEFTLVVADGVPFHRASHPVMRGEELSTPLFSRTGLASVDVLDAPADIEWSGSASGFLALAGRSAVGADRTALGGAWSGDPLWTSSALDLEAPGLMSFWGSGAAGVDIEPDRSRMFVAGEAMQVETPLEPRLPTAAAALLTALDADVAGALAEPAVARTRRASGLARLNWMLGPDRRLTLRATAGHLQREFTGFGPGALGYGGAPPGTATDFAVTGELVSTFDDNLAFELRGGVSGSSRTYEAAVAGVPATTLTGDGVLVGGPGGDAADVSRVDIHLSPVVHYPFGPGTVKGGASIRLTQHSLTWGGFDEARYWFGDAQAATDGAGALVVSSGVPKSSFSTTEVGAFAQYAFELSPGLRLTLGGRYDYEVLPSSEVERSGNWVSASGVANELYPTKLDQLGGVGSLAWDVTGDGRTTLDGTLSVTNGDMAASLLHEAFSHDGGARIARYAGTALQWPSTTAPSGAEMGPVLTILGPDTRSPRTTRASLGLVHHAADGWNLYVGATARRTDFLARRRDLNLAAFRLAVDSHGRDVIGDLQQFGALIVAQPESNRRFTGFDDVWAIDTDGWSEYRGGTIGVEHRSPMLDFFASYTRSRTQDNWVGAAAGVPEAQLPPGLPVDGDWTEGTSDFDVPDRLVGGLTVGLGPERVVSATAILRYESGLPFTPGYRAGVDANGDGSSLNDVAWVPDAGALSGLLSEWPCLEDQTDGFADRNSCRGPARTGVDVRVRARLARIGSRSLELTLDAYNLVERVDGLRDAALLLVDPSGSITTSSDGETLTLPVTVNPDFGEVLVPTGPGRVLRVGLRIGGAP